MPSNEMSRKILITGATDGIGLALARRYALADEQLVLIGRRSLDDLDGTFFNESNYCQVDLADSDSPLTIAGWLDDRGIEQLDLLVHNAGAGYVGSIGEQTAESIEQLVSVNLGAPIALTHALLPMVDACAGKLIFISSVASVLPGPDYAVYSATKAALDGFVRNLQVELAAGDNAATAHLIHPGATRTGMHAKSGLTLSAEEQSGFSSAEDVAEQIERLIERGPRRQAVGATNRLGLAAGNLMPDTVERIMRVRAAKQAKPGLTAIDTTADTEANADAVADTVTNTAAGKATDSPPHCVITGAADGIGRALALAFSAAGYTITGIDIDSERSMRTQAEIINQGGAARFLIADLSTCENVERVIAQLTTRPHVDILVHNAGINAVGAFDKQPLAPQLKVLDINLRAPMLLTAGLLKANHLVPGGQIICLASLSTFVGYPGAAVYAASKDGIVSYARSLSVALAGLGIQALTVFPGPTRTEHARRYSPDNRRESRRMPPETLARHIVKASQRRRRTLAPGVGSRVFAVLGRLAPRLTEQAMRKTMLDKLD
jgi:short-subunit dehydrogenase